MDPPKWTVVILLKDGGTKFEPPNRGGFIWACYNGHCPQFYNAYDRMQLSEFLEARFITGPAVTLTCLAVTLFYVHLQRSVRFSLRLVYPNSTINRFLTNVPLFLDIFAVFNDEYRINWMKWRQVQGRRQWRLGLSWYTSVSPGKCRHCTLIHTTPSRKSSPTIMVSLDSMTASCNSP